MSIFKLLQRLSRPTTKQVVIAVAYTLLLAGSIGLGVNARQSGSAATVRDCSPNSIDKYAGSPGCGAATPKELVDDATRNNPSDLQTIYNHFGLSTSEYSRFASTAKMGMAYRDGRIVVDGQTVMTGAWSIGRSKFSYSSNYPIGSHTYYKSAHTSVLKSDIPVMVMFDGNGTVEFASLTACGNPVNGKKVTSSVVCNALNKKQDATNPNKYTFTTSASVTGLAKISRVVYTFSDDNTTVTKTSLTAPVEHTFKKSGDVTVTVYATVPGGKEVKAAAVVNCKKHIDFKAPMFVCTAVVASRPNISNKKLFRFTVKTAQDPGITVKHADFNLDSTTTTTGVTTKDGQGNIYKDYTFNDTKEHVVKVTVFFNTLDGVKSHTSSSCQAKATADKVPPCEENPELPECKPPKECKPGIPEGDVRCTPECKPGIPEGDERCEDCTTNPERPECQPPEMPKTGAGSVLGLFAGTSLLAGLGHRFVVKRRAARQDNSQC
jgi:hypothetical protein